MYYLLLINKALVFLSKKKKKRLEIYNSCFTAKFGAGGVYGKNNPGSIHDGDHQLESVSSLDLLNRCIHNLISKVQAVLPSCDSSLFICFILSATIK